jgi:hypothetical protein
MKNFLKYGLIALLIALPVLSFAMEWRAGDNTSVGKDEKIGNDLYLAGGSVTSAGNVAGDLVAGGGNIVITGDVGADLIVGGGNVNILSNVGDDVRVGGGTVVVQGKVGGDLIVGGGQVNVGGPGVAGDVVLGGGNINITAPVAGQMKIAGGNVYINAPIAGDVDIEANKVTLGSNAVISGNLTYKAKSELVKEEGAVVKGKITFEPRENKMVPRAAFAALFSALLIWKFFALLACALVIGMLFRRWGKEIITLATERPIFELGRGVLVLVAMPAISVLLFMTVVGIPFGILGLLGFVIVMLFAWIVTPIIVGSVVYRYFSKGDYEVNWKTILLGVFICTLLGLIPFIGWVAQLLLIYITLGAITALKLQIIKEWR